MNTVIFSFFSIFVGVLLVEFIIKTGVNLYIDIKKRPGRNAQ